jgi:hypothetical protein
MRAVVDEVWVCAGDPVLVGVVGRVEALQLAERVE